jgi:hypothetical protein
LSQRRPAIVHKEDPPTIAKNYHFSSQVVGERKKHDPLSVEDDSGSGNGIGLQNSSNHGMGSEKFEKIRLNTKSCILHQTAEHHTSGNVEYS